MKFKFLIFPLLFLACQNKQEEAIIQNETKEEVTAILSDSVLKEKLELIRVEDQTLRLLLPDVNTKFGTDSKERDYFGSLIQQQDSICLAKITSILDEYGWIGENRVGYLANQTLWLVIQHAPLKTQEKYLPLLKESVKKGESEGWYLAFLEDRVLMYQGEKQIYGSQAKPNSETGKTHIYPIEDVSNVNKRRTELGLEPIEKYAEMNGYVFDINEHLTSQ